MERWLACTVLAAFILGDPAGAEEVTGRDRYWIDAAALKWKIGDAPQPTALVTAGSLAAPLPGALGQPGTSVQIGGTSVSLPMELGGRFALGTWVDRAAGLGIELGAFVLSLGTTRQSVSTNGLPGSATYAVPLFDLSGYTSGGAPGQSIYVLPGPFPNGPGFAGTMQRTMSARMLGAELVGVYRLHDDPRLKVEALAGYRWLQLTEELEFDVQTAGVAGSSNAGQMFSSHDGFHTRSSFNGAQLGMRAEAQYAGFVLRASLKGALGDMYRSLSVDGSSSTTAGTIFFPVSGGAGSILGGGIFAQPSNIGTYGSHQLAGVAELGVRTGYRVTDLLTPYIAYNALYVSSIIRPGDAMTPYINTTATALAAASRGSGFASPVGGPVGPTVNAGGTGVWIQDVSAGVALRF
jgi:Putative beta barrel porin-7 (BBP7)